MREQCEAAAHLGLERSPIELCIRHESHLSVAHIVRDVTLLQRTLTAGDQSLTLKINDIYTGKMFGE